MTGVRQHIDEGVSCEASDVDVAEVFARQASELKKLANQFAHIEFNIESERIAAQEMRRIQLDLEASLSFMAKCKPNNSCDVRARIGTVILQLQMILPFMAEESATIREIISILQSCLLQKMTSEDV